MSKIFRLHKGGSDGIVDWQNSNPIGESFINTIADPAGDNAKKQITSIPSPFARMDLVQTAFKYITAKGQLDGNTMYHRIVSEAFDIAEIFFNSEALKAKDIIEIIPWDAGIVRISGNDISINPTSELGKLLNSKNKKHKLLGETLKMFLLQDRDAYNFASLKQVYLINYKKGPEFVNIIGGTSPATLFFSSANEDIGGYIKNIQFGDHKVFDTNYYPLFKRSNDFIKYMFALRHGFEGFATLFKAIDDYLNLTVTHPGFPQEIKDEISAYTESTYADSYENVTVGNNTGFAVEILGHDLKGYKQGEIKSDFEIAATKQVEQKPFVLPNETYNVALNYVNGKWKPEYQAPYYDPKPLNTRSLPYQDHITYPYLTICDLLEPYIIRIPYPINKDKYFNGNFNESGYGYMLPIKKELFTYFSIKDVMGAMPDGKKFFELVKQAGDGVEAILRIPIKNGKYIKFSRLYALDQLPDDGNKTNEKENKGGIFQYNFGLTIYPFLKTGKDDGADYRVQLIDCDSLDVNTKKNKYEMLFYKENATGRDNDKINETELKPRTRSDKNDGNLATSIYQVLRKEFDIVEVRPNPFAKGILIPLLKTYQSGTDEFTFAIDFGTTNTHIEYKIGNGEPQPFEISETDMQIASLHYNNNETTELMKRARAVFGGAIDELTELIPKEFLPDKLGKGQDYRFPVRTVISEDRRLLKGGTTFTLADFNIPFVYEKRVMPANSKITSNLKWTNFSEQGGIEEKRVRAFIEKLVMMIKNKVLLNGGNLKATKIVWFYPSSMSITHRDTLEHTWNEFAKEHISAECKPKKLSESIAPFYYLKKRSGTLAHDRPVASLDIGGGTTDIVIYKDDKPINLTSFRFAANAIFGDGYGSSIANNGFVKKFLPILDKIFLENDSVSELKSAMTQIEERKLTAELITYFFSLENHVYIKRNNINLSFSKLLKANEDSKILFLFFFAAITYHLARLMKALKLTYPRYVTFSGNGSKIVNIIDNNIELKNLTGYANLIFSDVYGVEIADIELIQSPDPKEITCKGGLFCEDFNEDIENIKTVLVGDTEGSIMVNPEKTDKTFPYDKLLGNTALLESVKKEVENFIDKFFLWHDKFNYNKKFGALPANFGIIKAKMKEDLMNFLKAGLNEKLKEVHNNNNINIEEPLFFYPLVGTISKISQIIYTLSSTNN